MTEGQQEVFGPSEVHALSYAYNHTPPADNRTPMVDNRAPPADNHASPGSLLFSQKIIQIPDLSALCVFLEDIVGGGVDLKNKGDSTPQFGDTLPLSLCL